MTDLDKINNNQKEQGKTIATKVPMNIHIELTELVDCGAYLSISDFLRDAIREKLRRLKVADFRNINYSQAKKEVLSYFMKYKDCYLDEISLDLELDFELVYSIIKELLREGKILKVAYVDELGEMDFQNDTITESDDGFIRFSGQRIIVESKLEEGEFISLRRNGSKVLIDKNRGLILKNGSVILSECYRYIEKDNQVNS